MLKRIACLTSGGDAPGMNACIHALVKQAQLNGLEVWGIRGGFEGIFTGRYKRLKLEETVRFVYQGGTFLGTGRYLPFREPSVQQDAVELLRRRDISGLVVLGGDGSFRGVLVLHRLGLITAGIPATIDNNIPGSHYTLGHDTACNQMLRTVIGIHDTGLSLPGRIFLVETLGGDTGLLAEAAARAGLTEFVLCPEAEIPLADWTEKIKLQFKMGLPYVLVIVAEGCDDIGRKIQFIQEHTGRRVRITRLGHFQRGGSPTYFDHCFANQAAEVVMTNMAKGLSGFFAALENGRVVPKDLSSGNQIEQ